MFAALRLVWDVIVRRRAAVALGGTLAALALFGWRADLVRIETIGEIAAPTRQVAFADPHPSVHEAIVLPGLGTWEDIWFGDETPSIGGQDFVDPTGFRLFPRSGGMMLNPVPARADHRSAAGAVMGRPCWLFACPTVYLVPPKPGSPPLQVTIDVQREAVLTTPVVNRTNHCVIAIHTNARRISDYLPGSADQRAVGLYVHGLKIRDLAPSSLREP